MPQQPAKKKSFWNYKMPAARSRKAAQPAQPAQPADSNTIVLGAG